MIRDVACVGCHAHIGCLKSVYCVEHSRGTLCPITFPHERQRGTQAIAPALKWQLVTSDFVNVVSELDGIKFAIHVPYTPLAYRVSWTTLVSFSPRMPSNEEWINRWQL